MSADNVEVRGEIDAGWTSYWDKDEHGNPVGGSSPDEDGEIATEIIPSGIDPEDLTDKQRAIVEAVVMNPTASSKTVAEQAGATNQYVSIVVDKLALDVDWAARAESRGDSKGVKFIKATRDDDENTDAETHEDPSDDPASGSLNDLGEDQILCTVRGQLDAELAAEIVGGTCAPRHRRRPPAGRRTAW